MASRPLFALQQLDHVVVGPSQYLFDPEGNLVELKGAPDNRVGNATNDGTVT